MHIHFHEHHHHHPSDGPALAEINAKLDMILNKETVIMTQLSDATDKVLAAAEAEKTKDDSILTYVQGIPDVVKAAVADALATSGGDAQAMADKLNAVADSIGGDPDRVLAAITANTPPPPPPPPPAPVLVINADNLGAGQVGQPYTGGITLTVDGVVTPGSFTITSGALPDGLTDDGAGNFPGTPGTAGSFSFGVDASPAGGGSVSASLTITVNP